MASRWRRVLPSDGGRVYFFHMDSKEVAWALPVGETPANVKDAKPKAHASASRATSSTTVTVTAAPVPVPLEPTSTPALAPKSAHTDTCMRSSQPVPRLATNAAVTASPVATYSAEYSASATPTPFTSPLHDVQRAHLQHLLEGMYAECGGLALPWVVPANAASACTHAAGCGGLCPCVGSAASAAAGFAASLGAAPATAASFASAAYAPVRVCTLRSRLCAWEARHTESSGSGVGEVYYVHKVTGESVWERPEGMGDVSDGLTGTVAHEYAEDSAEEEGHVGVVGSSSSAMSTFHQQDAHLESEPGPIAGILALHLLSPGVCAARRALHDPSLPDDVTQLHDCLLRLVKLLERTGHMHAQEWLHILSTASAALPRWLLECLSPSTPVPMGVVVAKLLLNLSSISKALPLRLVNGCWKPAAVVVQAVLFGLAACTGRVGHSAIPDVTQVLVKAHRPASVQFVSVVHDASHSETLAPAAPVMSTAPTTEDDPCLDGLISPRLKCVAHVDEEGLSAWMQMLCMLCEALTMDCEPVGDGVMGFDVLSASAMDVVTLSIAASGAEAFGGSVKYLAYLSVFYPPSQDCAVRSLWVRPELSELAQAIVGEINSVRSSDCNSESLRLCACLLELSMRLLCCSRDAILFFTNDMKVLIDVILQQLVDLSPADEVPLLVLPARKQLPMSSQRRHQFTHLLRCLMLHSQWSKRGYYRRPDILAALEAMYTLGLEPLSGLAPAAKLATERTLEECLVYLDF